MEGRLDRLAGVPLFSMPGRRALNLIEAMIVDGLNEKDLNTFYAELYRTPDEWAEVQRRKAERRLQLVREVGEVHG